LERRILEAQLYFGIFLLLVFQLGVGYFTFERLSTLSEEISAHADRLNAFSQPELDPLSMIAEIKNGIEDVVADTISNLEPPRAIDHVFGAVAQLIQMKAMGAMNALPEGVLNMAESVMGSTEDV